MRLLQREESGIQRAVVVESSLEHLSWSLNHPVLVDNNRSFARIENEGPTSFSPFGSEMMSSGSSFTCLLPGNTASLPISRPGTETSVVVAVGPPHFQQL